MERKLDFRLPTTEEEADAVLEVCARAGADDIGIAWDELSAGERRLWLGFTAKALQVFIQTGLREGEKYVNAE